MPGVRVGIPNILSLTVDISPVISSPVSSKHHTWSNTYQYLDHPGVCGEHYSTYDIELQRPRVRRVETSTREPGVIFPVPLTFPDRATGTVHWEAAPATGITVYSIRNLLLLAWSRYSCGGFSKATVGHVTCTQHKYLWHMALNR